ncbi:DNA-processing protein DprA [Streptomyces lonarensis]|uniref:DNA-protecting protein DprA n=1 Tax=Streptomyces lonarensis TaxID=700599 RepID=A0A7X6CXV1_9ACTN|nr:DNA-processing protein DprA [Streptomyces lonarensis]NJQ04567.1 DNA-protecting protein DprA [Streptomyces lonarensis]
MARVALSAVTEPGDTAVGAWVAERGPAEVWRALREGTPGHPLPLRRWEGFRHRVTRTNPDASLARAAACGARFICPGDGEWPTQLADLGTAAPIGLWVRGTASLRLLALRSVAVVGARACTDYGSWVATDLARCLATRGWTVASGAAYGIDGAAHQGALRGEGRTVAVLASGVDTGYPAGHAGLLERIRSQGLVVSELPPGGHPTRHRFLQRNRLLAALTRGTVVVEAAPRSGALATARRASALGRHVMGVPGSVLSAQSDGVHQLLRGGAHLVSRAEEVIELVGAMGELADVAGRSDPRDLLAEPAGRVLGAVPPRGSAPVAQIAADACCGVAATHAALLELCAFGYVERDGESWALRRGVRSDAPSMRPGRE